MKIHHWLLALLVFYVTIAALPDARLIWSLNSMPPVPEWEPALEYLPEPQQAAPPATFEFLLLLDLAAWPVVDQVGGETEELEQRSGEGWSGEG